MLNIHIFIHSTYKIFKKCTQFCTFNVHNLSKNVHNLYNQYTYFSMYPIFYIQHTYFFNEFTQFSKINYTFFKQCTQVYTFSVHIFFTKNVPNYMLIACTQLYTFHNMVHIKCIRFCTFNEYFSSKNVPNCVHSTIIIF